jgi:hypothetical protein
MTYSRWPGRASQAFKHCQRIKFWRQRANYVPQGAGLQTISSLGFGPQHGFMTPGSLAMQVHYGDEERHHQVNATKKRNKDNQFLRRCKPNQIQKCKSHVRWRYGRRPHTASNSWRCWSRSRQPTSLEPRADCTTAMHQPALGNSSSQPLRGSSHHLDSWDIS